ncbi:hypothetical protein [Ramlibacter sp.]|uniref:hypothetical protein n=1 Tax=Ramlibacter sp. TaxID=1917967 RepID=UPI002D7EDC66|nr:hypothetical protein [Ramlibacter sp.]
MEREPFYESMEFWLVVLTALLVGVTYRLVHFTKKLWGATAELVKDSQDKAEKQLRAYLNVRQITAKYEQGEGPLTATVLIENFGQTPAHDVRITANIQTVYADTVLQFDLEHLEGGGMGVMGPRNTYTLHATTGQNVTQRMRMEVNNGDAIVYVWGLVTYGDEFGRTHSTVFRMRMSGPDGQRGTFSPCPDGNSAD